MNKRIEQAIRRHHNRYRQ